MGIDIGINIGININNLFKNLRFLFSKIPNKNRAGHKVIQVAEATTNININKITVSSTTQIGIREHPGASNRASNSFRCHIPQHNQASVLWPS